jgi:hypothetical protein
MGSSRWRIPKLTAAAWGATVLAFALVRTTVAQAEWSQWRGPGRDCTVSGAVSTRPWLAAPVRVWERTVGGGYAGPVVADGRIWVHSRSRSQEVVTCLTLSQGERVWSARYDADFKHAVAVGGAIRSPLAARLGSRPSPSVGRSRRRPADSPRTRRSSWAFRANRKILDRGLEVLRDLLDGTPSPRAATL